MQASSKRHSMPVPRPLQLASALSDGSPSAVHLTPTTTTTPTTPSGRRPSSIIYDPPLRAANSTGHRAGLVRSNSVGGLLDRRKSAPERSPVTLAEKHKDLLTFIAQKEAKCVELRAQLRAHEEELLQLKRKWERIVSRGFTSPENASFTSTTSTSSGSSIENSPNPTSANGGAVMDGIREGVQGVGRFIAAFSPGPYSSLESVISPTRRTHSSNSSSSTIATSKSTRFSQSSTSSIEEEPGQVLMVQDTGATPTMSPNPAFNARQQRARSRAHTPDSSAEAEADFFAANASLQLLDSSTSGQNARPASKRMASTSVIPGLALVESVAPVSAWVGTVGKKWEELQRVPSVAKNTKRASLLFSDIAYALQGPPPTTPSPSASPSISSASLLDDDSSSDAMMPQAPALTPAPAPSLKLSARMASSRQQQPQSPLSLAKSKSEPAQQSQAASTVTNDDDDDDDWNW
ncbi:hypothetical protein C8F01DRAFT_1371852 [Mycena amicta]|nr:hypothetical protein C8F01DRAFT_1371852 [Mycena amicta]